MCHFFYTYSIVFLSDRWQNENLKAQSLCGLQFSPIYYIDICKVFWVYLLVIRVDLQWTVGSTGTLKRELANEGSWTQAQHQILRKYRYQVL
jgi:hypothetical protein